jgi:hypothetical protein
MLFVLRFTCQMDFDDCSLDKEDLLENTSLLMIDDKRRCHFCKRFVAEHPLRRGLLVVLLLSDTVAM